MAGAPLATVGTSSFGGAATFHQRVATGWLELQVVEQSSPSFQAHFGTALAIEGTRAVIAAPDAVNEQTGNLSSGDVYVFEFNGSVWVETARLLPSIVETKQRFGIDVELEGDRIVVGTEQLIAARGTARVYVFEYDGTNWVETAIITEPDWEQGDYFGSPISLQGDLLAITSRNDDDGVVGATNLTTSGAVYLYRQEGGAWNRVAKLVASDARDGLQFGNEAHLAGDELLAGLQGELDVGGVRVWGIDESACDLESDTFTASLSDGASIDLEITTTPSLAGKLHALAGTTAGTKPGITIGSTLVPLNDDGAGGYLELSLHAPINPPLLGSLGFLDGAGNATATFVVAPLTDPVLAGLTLHHAAVVLDNPGPGGILHVTNASRVLVVE